MDGLETVVEGLGNWVDDLADMVRAVVNNQSVIKSELLGEIKKVEEKLTKMMNGLEVKIDNVENRLTKRINRLGVQLNEWDSDVRRREEFDELVLRVEKMEEKTSLVN